MRLFVGLQCKVLLVLLFDKFQGTAFVIAQQINTRSQIRNWNCF
jgi:hypothetical protein